MESLEEIYQKHAQTVYAFLLSRTRNRDLAEELTQETFFQAVRSIDSFRGDGKLTTWLCGIARNLWLAHMRESRKVQPLEEMEDLAGPCSPEEELCLQWDNLEILKLLHGLKEPMREVMYLRLIGNLTFGQIGEIMGQSENWARVNFYRGKEIVRKEADKHER
ncbi:sigma-70 family RNA polymerase sigma factor [bacterium 1XD21-13]|nr:sigma-70 family RNA polymerase sigma factor [bacterium 1XD21-13]